MADAYQSAVEHDIELPVQPDPEDDRDRPYRAPHPDDLARPWARALAAVLEEPMREPPAAVSRDFYQAVVGETWQQRGEECTGFALAAIANFHLRVEQLYRSLVEEVIGELVKPLLDGRDESVDVGSLSEMQQVELLEAFRIDLLGAFKASREGSTDLPEILKRRIKPEAVNALLEELRQILSEDWSSKSRLRAKLFGPDQWWEFRSAAADLFLQSTKDVEKKKDEEWTSPALRELLRSSPAKVSSEYVPRVDSETIVSRRMLYEMAQRYDQEAFDEGSTLRGALRGWDAVGVADDKKWPYAAGDEHGDIEGDIGLTRMLDAVQRPGAYYFRLDATKIDAMKKALARGGGSYPLYCSARLHAGWYRLFLPGADERPVIRQTHGDESEGYHAFVIVGYDDNYRASAARDELDRQEGFWVHNSWGEQWGVDGYGFLPYDDWRRNAGDAWAVIPQSSPVLLESDELNEEIKRAYIAVSEPPEKSRDDEEWPPKTTREMWPHLVPIGDDGRLVSDAPYGIDKSLIKTLLYLFQEQTSSDYVPRLVLFADGGYLPRNYSVDLLKRIRVPLLQKRIFPIFLVWDKDWWTLTRNWIDDLTSAKLDTFDLWSDPTAPEVHEIVAESFAPRVWNEVKRRARLAVDLEDGAARLLARAVSYKWDQQHARGKPFQIHLIGHGAGDLLLAELAQLLPAPITTCTLWAPATSIEQFEATYRPMLEDGRLEHLTVFALDETMEEAYGVQNVLHLVSNILEFDWPRQKRAEAFGKDASPHRPMPLLGMQRYLVTDPTIGRLRDEGKLDVQIMRYPYHELLVADAAAARRKGAFERVEDGGQRMLHETIEHITGFTQPPRPRRQRTATRLRTVDPLVRAQAALSTGRAGPPGGLRA